MCWVISAAETGWSRIFLCPAAAPSSHLSQQQVSDADKHAGVAVSGCIPVFPSHYVSVWSQTFSRTSTTSLQGQLCLWAWDPWWGRFKTLCSLTLACRLLLEQQNYKCFNSVLPHRNEKLFEDPDTFRPERFYEKQANETMYQFLPFIIGTRMCLGYKFAQLEMKALMVVLLQQLQYQPIKGQQYRRLLRTTMRPDPPLELEVSRVKDAQQWHTDGNFCQAFASLHSDSWSILSVEWLSSDSCFQFHVLDYIQFVGWLCCVNESTCNWIDTNFQGHSDEQNCERNYNIIIWRHRCQCFDDHGWESFCSPMLLSFTKEMQ